MLNIKWPNKISNKKLYDVCDVGETLSWRAISLRWSLFGHILRLDEEVPARKAMTLYCNHAKGSRGRPKTTLPVLLWAEAKKEWGKSPTLKQFSNLAQKRHECWEFSQKVIAKNYGSLILGGRKAKKTANASERIHKWETKG